MTSRYGSGNPGLLVALCAAGLMQMLAWGGPGARPAVAATKVAAGAYHALAVAADGSVWTWGDDLNSSAGTIPESRTVPSKVSGLTGATSAAGGYRHRMVLKSDGTVWTWGDNFYGQLGDGTTTDRSTPMPVAGLTGVVAVAAGQYHSLALKSDGTVWGWGYNGLGGLGDGTTTNRSTPVRAAGLTGVVAVAAGEGFSLALKGDGTVWAWGYNSYGQLADGTETSRNTPVQARGLTGVTAIAAGGHHALAVMGGGSVRAWGGGSSGQLGNGTTTFQVTTPTTVAGLTGVKSVAGGSAFSVAVKTDGTVWTWGRNNYGQLGDGTLFDRTTPVQVTGVAGADAVASGYSHCVALMRDGTMAAWGRSGEGQLGSGTTPNRNTPVRVSGLGTVTALAAGGLHSLALKSDGTVWTWGYNYFGQLGNGTTIGRSIPAQLTGIFGVKAIAGGGNHSLALKNDGTVSAWGYDGSGQLGTAAGTSSATPAQVSGLAGVAAVAGGSSHSLALKGDGTVWAWGDNTYGQLGDGTTTNRRTPAQVSGLTGVVAISAYPGGSQSFALKGDGTVWSWGDNREGQLGDGTITSRSLPVPVSGLTGITAVAGGSLALKNDGTIWIWGNYPNDLVDGWIYNRRFPLRIGRPTGIIGLATHGSALKSDGTVWNWGANASGQLGDGTTAERTTAVQVGGLTGALAVVAGYRHRMAMKSDGTVVAWGDNEYGQLGDGASAVEVRPVPVVPLGAADLVIEKTHSGNFTSGLPAAYTLTVRNVGASATSGVITVTDTLPQGLSNPNGSGENWTCSVNGRILTCTNPGPIQPGAASTITLNVDVVTSAYPGLTNVATVSNPGDQVAYNNTAGDPHFVTGNGCTYSVTPPSALFPVAGGSASFAIQTDASCPWTVVGLPAWIAVAGANTGAGPGTVTLFAAANASTARTANVTIAGISVTVSQVTGVCAYVLSATGHSFSSSAGTGSVDIVTVPGCQWTAASPSPWLTFTSAASGTGSGRVAFQAAANTSGAARAATLAIAGLAFTVQQAGSLPANAAFAGAMPQVASGAGWKTTFTIMNTGVSAITIRLNYWGDDGKELILPMSFPQSATSNLILGSTMDRTLDAGATLIIESEAGAAAPVLVGWAELLSTGAVSGLAVFRQRSGDGREQEAAVPLESRTATGYLLQFDNAGYATGIAAANHTAGSVNLTVIQRDDTGKQLGTETLPLPAKGHTSFDLRSRWAVLGDKRGTIEVRGAAPGSLSILGLRFHPQGPFTTLPVAAK